MRDTLLLMAETVTTTTTQTTVVSAPAKLLPLTWSALEYEEKDRHPDWIWYAGLIFAVAATLAFFYGNIFFGIFLVIAGAAVIMFTMHAPKMVVISIDEKEVCINDETIPYDRIKQFWIDETEKPDKLLLLVSGSFVPMISLPLAGVTAETVRARLLAHVPEKEMRESLGIKIAERLGF